LAQKDEDLISKAEKNQQIKQITQELLDRLASQGKNDHAADSDLAIEQQSRHESDSSSLAEEKEIHNKLTQILNLIGDDRHRDESGEEFVRSEEEFSQRIVDDVLDDNSEDLDLYQIQ